MSRPAGLRSWRDTGSLANENSREAPSHRECHCNIPGSAQTYKPWAWKQTHVHTCTQMYWSLRVEMFTLQSAFNMHIPTDMSDLWICACWHIYIRARLSRPGPWWGLTGLMPLPSGHRWGGVTTWQRCRQRDASHSTVSPRWHNLSHRLNHIPAFGGGSSAHCVLLPAVYLCCDQICVHGHKLSLFLVIVSTNDNFVSIDRNHEASENDYFYWHITLATQLHTTED